MPFLRQRPNRGFANKDEENKEAPNHVEAAEDAVAPEAAEGVEVWVGCADEALGIG